MPTRRRQSHETPELFWFRISPYSNVLQSKLDEEPVTFDELLLAMAERLFAIERGRPPRTFGELLGPDLKALPDGIAPYDPIKPGSP
jgi:hypothetical protein